MSDKYDKKEEVRQLSLKSRELGGASCSIFPPKRGEPMKNILRRRSRTLWLVAALATGIVACVGQSNDTSSSSASELSRGMCENAPNWALNASYRRGTLVKYNGKAYECIQSHTSFSPDWTPDAVPALWGETHCGSGGGTTSGSSGSNRPPPPPPRPEPPQEPPGPQCPTELD